MWDRRSARPGTAHISTGRGGQLSRMRPSATRTLPRMARTAGERRRWTSTLAERMPEGPQGQPAHQVGAEVTVADLVEVPNVGQVSITVARPSALLLGSATLHARKAARLREVAAKQIGRSD